MNTGVEYVLNKASETRIAEHLLSCDRYFVPLLSARVEIAAYAHKIANNAARFEAWSGDALVGMIAAYCNDQQSRVAYITSVSVEKGWMGHGIAAQLMGQCVRYARMAGMHQIRLEVASDNVPAIRLYKKSGFNVEHASVPLIGMNLVLKGGEEHVR